MDIGSWLRGLGLGQYETAFRENEVDGDILPKLTVDDLRDLGIVAVGHRRKIMSAIEAMNAAPAVPIAAGPSQPAPSEMKAPDAAERRQLTVMFSDLVGSTAMSSRLDPEDMRRVIRAYQDAVSGVVVRYDGFVAKFMGDGVLAYFGFPRAHEDDAARAVHAGLEIARVVAALQTPARESLAARIGIATGLVVVGDIVGEGAAQEQAVVGDTPNLAARLQGLADAGGVVVSAATRRLVGEGFRLKDVGRHAVKGLAEPVEAFAALGVASSESRFEAAHASRPTGFVGREEESTELVASLRRAWEGRGQIVLISGEAGIGKSRLSAWVAEQAGEIPHTRLRYQCSPYYRDSALYPFTQQFERAAGFAAQDAPEEKLDKLEKVLGQATDRLDEVAPLIAAMLSIPTATRYPPLKLSPAQQRRQTLFALLHQMEGLAKKQPIFMVFEDAHWADATSLEALDLAIERMRKLPVLMLITFRPEFDAPWRGLPDVAEIALGRLEPSQAEALVSQVTGGRRLPEEVLAQIVAKTDGVPLFVEELTKNVLESGLLIEEADRYRLDGPLPPLAIPSTLQDSLMARLDRLASVKEVAQIGAAIGREFSYALLLAVVGRDEATLRVALAQLEESELVFRAGEPPAARYTFKHALVQDTAYESLLKSRRQILHQRIAEALRDKFPDVVEAAPELIAEHYTRAGLVEPAIVHWGKAGDLALRRSAFKEAIAHLGKAIEMTEARDGDKDAGRSRLNLALGNALMQARGFAAPETTAAFARARELAGGTAETQAAAYGEWMACLTRGDLPAMREYAARFIKDAEVDPGSSAASLAHRVNGHTHYYAGEYVAARDSLDRALALVEPDRDREPKSRFFTGDATNAMGVLASVLWSLGETEGARRMLNRMTERLNGLSHAGSVAVVRLVAALFEVMRGDPDRVAPHASAFVKIVEEHDLEDWKRVSLWLEGWTFWRLSGRESGRERIREPSFRAAFALGGPYIPIMAITIAEANMDVGDIASALSGIDAVIAKNEALGRLTFQAELHRTRGEILLKQTPADPAPAEAAFLTAIAVAQSQKARSFELRAALALAKLYHSTNRAIEACDLLGSALEGFSPTPEFPEIAEGTALLETLKSDDGVRADAARRAVRLKLQTDYAQAVMWSKGFAAEETKTANVRASNLAAEAGAAVTPLDAYHARWGFSYFRGEFRSARETAEGFVRAAESRARPMEAAAAHRLLGLTHVHMGNFVEARAHCEHTLRIYDPERDREGKFRLGLDSRAMATAYLAHAAWHLGEVGRAREFRDDALARAVETSHPPTLAAVYLVMAWLENVRNDAKAALQAAEAAMALCQEHEIPTFLAVGGLHVAVARAKLGDQDGGSPESWGTLEAYRREGNKTVLPFFLGALAENETGTQGAEAALGGTDEALALADETGEHWFDSELHRIRGDILLKQTRADTAAAEAAFLTAIAIAQSQKARSFELRAALALARLYQSTNRPVEAHDVLGSALEGFSPTSEFPEVAEAKALLERLTQSKACHTEG